MNKFADHYISCFNKIAAPPSPSFFQNLVRLLRANGKHPTGSPMMAGFVPRAAETSVVQTVTPSIRQMTDPLGETFHHGGMIYNGSRHVAPPVYDKLRFPAKGPMRGGDTVFKKYDELYDKVDLSKVAPNGPVPTVVPR